MSTDAIVLLKKDHKEMRKLFREFEKAGEDAVATKARVGAAIIEALTVHTYIENEVHVPAGCASCCRTSRTTSSSPTRSTTWRTCWSWSWRSMAPDSERFVPKMTVLMENVKHHMAEEEDDWFPKVREGLGRKQLQELGAEMAERRK